MSRLGYQICVVKRSDLGWSSRRERGMPRIVFLDLETSSLEADGGIIVGAGVMSETGQSEYFEARRTGQEKPLLSKLDRKSTRLNSSHGYISYAVFCLKKKKR